MSIKAQDTVTYDASVAIALAGQAQGALDDAVAVVIDSPTMYDLAADDLRRIKRLQKEVEEKRTGITGPLNQAVKAVNDLFRAPKEYLDKAEATLKRSMVAWSAEQERIAMEARRKAEEEARAERERLAAIERDKAEAARRAELEAQQAAEQGDREALEKAQAEARAARAEAAQLAATAAVVMVAPEVEAPARAAGIAGRVTYSAQVDDLMQLVQAVAAGTAPIEALQADTKFLNTQAKAFKKPGQLYPGVTIVAQRGIAARAA